MYVTQHSAWGRGGFRKTVSWRTGRSTAGHHAVPAAAPVSSGSSLGARIAARRQYLTAVSANLSGQALNNGYGLTGDSGHDFDSIKVVPSVANARFLHSYRGGPPTIQDGVLYSVPALSSNDRSFASSVPNPGYGYAVWNGPSLPSFQRWRSSAYADASLSAPLSGWGETIVELATGNLPRLLPSLMRRIQQGKLLDPKGTGKDLGSEYLNAQFGIMPIIRDVQSVIANLAMISDGLYGEYSRKRSSPLEVVSYSEHGNIYSPSIKWAGSMGTGSQRANSSENRMISDMRLTMKLVRAQPTIGANDFLARAMDLFQNLGLSKPSLGWDVIPWSWMLDWVTNIGSSIDNAAYYSRLSGSNKTRYAYCTQKTITTRVTDMAMYWTEEKGTWNKYEGPSTLVSVCTRLTRNASSPFGFDFRLPDLTVGQWSILVALGLAKRP